MTTFDSTKLSLPTLLNEIATGEIQLPDFQRGWVWDDERIRSLLVSIARSFPVGAIMLMETGGKVQFQERPVEGVKLEPGTTSERLILDGQQRLTSLTQAIKLTAPVQTRTTKGKQVKRYYYFDIEKALSGSEHIEEAVISVDESRQIRTNFDRDVVLDLSTRELECEQMYFPCNQIFNWADWLQSLNVTNPAELNNFLEFQKTVLEAFNQYQLPVIELKKETSKEAVCLVFEKVNTGGVSLSVFELVTAGYAAEGYNLRDDWFGSELRQVESRAARLHADPLLTGLDAPEFLQAITLIYTYHRKQQDLQEGKQGKQVRALTAKRTAVLDLPLEAYKKWADKLEEGFKQAANFLRMECFYDVKEVPYSTQLVPLAAVMTLLQDSWREPRNYKSLARWFWSGVLGELYGGAVETRIANDLEDLMLWFKESDQLPRTVIDASFQPDRLYSLRSRNSAAYKAISTLVLREGAQDFFWQGDVQELMGQGISLDIHHIFPKRWCDANGINYKDYDHIINKTPISAKANRKIGGRAPSDYLALLQDDPQVALTDEEMDEVLASHGIPAQHLRENNYEAFIAERKSKLLHLIGKAMGKPVMQQSDA